jgi:putative phage-type endonuclease
VTITEPISADPNDPAWIEARRTFIGASDAPAVLGISPWATPLDVWADKLSLGQRERNLAMDMGHALEELIAQEWLKQAPRNTVMDNPAVTVRHPDHPNIAASVDRIVTYVDMDGAHDELVECKYVGPTTAWAWRDGVPVYVQAQAQVQMSVTGAQRCHVAALIVDYAPTFFTQTIERSDDVIAEIIGRLNTFWAEHVEAQQRPDLDLSWNAGKVSDALARIYAEPTPGSAVRLNSRCAELIAQRKHAKAIVKDLEEQLEQIDNELRATLGDATEGFIDDNAKPAVTWRPQTRSKWDVAAVLARKGAALDGFLEVELDIAERVLRAVETTNTIRVLRVS